MELKTRKNEKEREVCGLMSLPYELVVDIMAQVLRLDLIALAMVSKIHGLPQCQNPKTKEFIAKDKKLKGSELIKGVHLDTVPFNMERDLITPSYNKKRPQLLKYYQKEIDEMYNKVKK